MLAMAAFCLLGHSVNAAEVASGSAVGAAPALGDTPAQIAMKLGAPRSSLEAGNRIIYQYPNGDVTFVNGRATEIALDGPAVPVAKVPATAPSAPVNLGISKNPGSAVNPPDTTDHPANFRLVERRDAEGVISILAESDMNTEFTVTLQVDLTNMTASQPLPVTMDSAGQKSIVLVQIQRTDPTKAWSYKTNFNARAGARRAAKTNDAVYLLPYGPTETHRLDQGNYGAFSHSAGTGNELAFDFGCPEGTIVCAAREGVVTGLRQDFSAGGTDEKFKALANYVIIKHADGTFAEYYHLQHNGVIVTLGQHVEAGQAIAKSGATGFASAPHIHFSVFKTLTARTGWNCR